MIENRSILSSHAKKNRNFARYKVSVNKEKTLASLLPQFTKSKLKLGVNEFSYYESLISYLKHHPQCVVRPMKDLYQPISDGTFALSIRHDVDMDPFSAIQLSRTLSSYNLPGTFYLLHTGHYYGEMRDGHFFRFGNVLKELRDIQDQHNCEIGLHTDGLWLYQQEGIDGADAIKTELTWLRTMDLLSLEQLLIIAPPFTELRILNYFKDEPS